MLGRLLAEWIDPEAEITERRAKHPLLVPALGLTFVAVTQAFLVAVSLWRGAGVLGPQVGVLAGVALVVVLSRFGMARLMASTALERVAGSPRATEGALRVCAENWDWTVRKVVGTNERASGELLERLAGDPVPDVRAAVAENPAAPPAAVVTLAGDPESSVTDAVAVRDDLNPDAVDRLSRSGSLAARRAAASHPLLGDDAAMRLAADIDPEVRVLVAANPAACEAARSFASLAGP